MAETATPIEDAAPVAKKERLPLYLLVCVYNGDVTTVFVGMNFQRAAMIRDSLRKMYGQVAQFHTVSTTHPPKRWLRWEREIRVSLGMAIAPEAEAAQ